MVNRLILESNDGEILGEDEDFSVLPRSLAAIDGNCAKRELSLSIVAIDFCEGLQRSGLIFVSVGAFSH